MLVELCQQLPIPSELFSESAARIPSDVEIKTFCDVLVVLLDIPQFCIFRKVHDLIPPAHIQKEFDLSQFLLILSNMFSADLQRNEKGQAFLLGPPYLVGQSLDVFVKRCQIH